MHLPGKAGGRDRGRGWDGIRLIERGLGAAVGDTAVGLFMCGVAVGGSSDGVAAVRLTAAGGEGARLGRSRKIIYHVQSLDEI